MALTRSHVAQIRWGILGTGAVAEQFAYALQSIPSATTNLVVSGSLDRAKTFAGKFKIPNAAQEQGYDFGKAPVDVFYIATPNALHAKQCLTLLEADKPVLCEKPFAVTAAEAEPVVSLALEKKIFCMEAMWMRFSPAVQTAIRTVREGTLGEVQAFRGDLGFAHDQTQRSRLFEMPGGGALLDLGVYPLSLAHALFGTPVAIKSFSTLNSEGADLSFSTLLLFPKQVQATISASVVAQFSNTATVFGTEANLHLNAPLYFPETYRITKTAKHQLGKRTSTLRSQILKLPGVRPILNLSRKGGSRNYGRHLGESGYTFEALEVQRCLQQGLFESPDMPLNLTLEVMRSVDRIRESWTTKEETGQ